MSSFKNIDYMLTIMKLKFTGIILIALFFQCSQTFLIAQTIKICAECKKAIEGSFIEYKGKFFHSEHFVCSKCNKPLGGKVFYETDDGLFDKECYEEFIAPRCSFCGKPLSDEYIVSNELKYHKSCFEKNIAIRCVICSEIIEGTYSVDHWGNKFHTDHRNEIPECSFCGRLMTKEIAGGGFHYSDGTDICKDCGENAIKDISRARKITQQIRLQLEKQGIKIQYGDIPLKLVGRDELQKDEKTDGHKTRGITHQKLTYTNKSVSSRNISISLQYGMPELSFIATAAHELMHVYQYLNSPDNNHPAFCEGSCNFASYLILRENDDKLATYILKSMEEDEDPHYGAGYRRVKAMVEKKGIAFWLESLRKSKSFPSGY